MAELFPDGPPRALDRDRADHDRAERRAAAIRTLCEAAHPDYTVSPSVATAALVDLGVSRMEIGRALR